MLACQDDCSATGSQQRCVLAESTGQRCSGSDALEILCEVKKQYENLVAEVEADTDATDSQRTEVSRFVYLPTLSKFCRFFRCAEEEQRS